MFQILVKAKTYDDDIIDILANGGSMWWGDQGDSIVGRCWCFATRICNDALRESLRNMFPAFFPTASSIYDIMTIKAAFTTQDVKVLSYYWDLSQMPDLKKQNVARGLYLRIMIDNNSYSQEIVAFLQNKIQ
jgi:hypothetical protein